jgi:hypothetical protein
MNGAQERERGSATVAVQRYVLPIGLEASVFIILKVYDCFFFSNLKLYGLHFLMLCGS